MKIFLKTAAFLLLSSIAVGLVGGDWRSPLKSRVHRNHEETEASQFSNPFIVTSVLNPPFLMLKSPGEGGQPLLGNDRYEGFIPDLLNEIFRILNVDFVIRLSEDGRYGSPQANGSWTGMIGELMRGEADLAAADLLATYTRQRVVDFVLPYLHYNVDIVLKRPPLGGQYPIIIRSFADLSRQSIIQYNGLANIRSIFRFSKQAIYQRMWMAMSSEPPIQTSMEGYRKVMESNGTFAFLTETISARYISGKLPCQLKTVHGDLLSLFYYSLAVPIGSPWKSRLDLAILSLRESETIKMLVSKWWFSRCAQESWPGTGW